MKKGILLFGIIAMSLMAVAQSRTILSQKEIGAINTMYRVGWISVKADGWYVDPDVWNQYNYVERKAFTEKLSVYYKNYTDTGKQMSGFCYFYNMATKKKIARWYKNEYKEY
jgi:hypothetical protein